MTENFSHLMERVARELLGAPNESLSSKKEWRYGTHGSLAIDLAKGVFHDFEANEGGGVLDLIAREKGLRGKEAVEFMRAIGCDIQSANDKSSSGNGARKLIATFDYHDADGDLVFQVCRYEPKAFSQRRPGENGEWIWKGGPSLPYRLPQVLEAIASGHPVFIVEGERKADALAKWNIAATCNAGGAKKWKPEHSDYLRGADVIILPDNDAPGRDHANVAGDSLQGIAANIRLLELPGLKHKGDIVNWIATGGTVEHFWHLVETQARAWAPFAEDSAPEDDEPEAPANNAPSTNQDVLAVENFYAYMPMHNYIYAPTRETWPASSVNARVAPINGIPANAWIDKDRAVEQLSWIPGAPMLINGRLISEGGWIEEKGNKVFNLYRAPTIAPGNPDEVKPWIDHIEMIYPDDAGHIIRWLAHRVQSPGEKINHALVLGGPPGVGKDTLLEPVKRAIGPWNFIEVSPAHMLGRFNGYVKSVILRISEARDLGDVNRFAFYDHMKVYTAAPPDVLRCDEKNLREYSVPNVCGVVITTNYKGDGIYLPADDRRHYVAWCDLTKESFSAHYWNALYEWYENEGYRNVAAYLARLDLSDFDPKAPPPNTPAFWAIVDSNRSPEDADLADTLDEIGKVKRQTPVPAVTLQMLIAHASSGEFQTWLQDRKNRRVIPHRLETAEYIPVRNPDAPTDGLWKIGDRRQAVYGHSQLSVSDRLRAARALADQGG